MLLIDGGPGQLAQATEVLQQLEIDNVLIAGVAKGADRRPGQERLFLPGHELPTLLPPDSPALHLIQRVRDEAHRFAITGHRGRRQKARSTSRLEDIPGIGPRRRASLLRHFGGLAGLKGAVDDFHRRGVKVFLPTMPWDNGTRAQARPTGRRSRGW